MYFLYYGIDRISQKKVRGLVEASEYSDAYAKVIDIGYIPEKINELPKWFPVSLFRSKPHMRINEIIEFLEAIGHGFNAGIQITEILIDYRNEIGRKKAQAAVQAIIEDLREGSSFSSTLKNWDFSRQQFFLLLRLAKTPVIWVKMPWKLPNGLNSQKA